MRIARKIRRIPKVLFVMLGLSSFYLIFLYAANYRESVLLELYDDEPVFEPQIQHLEPKELTKLQIETQLSDKINDLEKLFKNEIEEQQLEKNSQINVAENYEKENKAYKAVQFITKSVNDEYKDPINEQPEEQLDHEQWDHEKEAMADNRVVIERTTPEQAGNNEQPLEVEKSSIEKEMEKYLNVSENADDFEQRQKFEQPDVEISKEIFNNTNSDHEKQFQNEQHQLEQPDEQPEKEQLGMQEEENKILKKGEKNLRRQSNNNFKKFDDNENIDEHFDKIEENDNKNQELNHENQGNIENIDDNQENNDHENEQNNNKNQELNHENQGNVEQIEDKYELNQENVEQLNDDTINRNFEIVSETLDKNGNENVKDLEGNGYRSRKIYDQNYDLDEQNLKRQRNNNLERTTAKNNIFNVEGSIKELLNNSNDKHIKEHNIIHSDRVFQENDKVLQNQNKTLSHKLIRSIAVKNGTNEWFAEASATNRTSVLSNLLIYNRVPKCGSTTFKTLLGKLSQKNHFTHESSKIFGDRFLQGAREREFVEDLMQKQSKSGTLFSMDRHVCFVDFKKYGYPQPTYINVIRDPIQKFVSTFYYIRSQKRWINLLKGKQSPSDLQNLLNYHKDSMPPEAFKEGKLMMPFDWWMNKNLSECVLSGDKECKYETGSSKETTVAFLCGGEKHCRIVNGVSAIQQAKYNLETQYSVVGIVEQIEETMVVMEHYIPRFMRGINKTYQAMDSSYRQGNKTPHPDPPDEVREILLKNLVGDIEIYNFAKQKLYLQYKHIQSLSSKVN